MFWDKFLRKLIDNRVLVIILVVGLVAAGGYSYYSIPKQENPDTTVAAAYVTTVYPGASPAEVDAFVTSRMEDELLKLDSVDYIQSQSVNSASVSVLMYENDVAMQDVYDDLVRAVDSVQSSLPDMCQESVVTAVNISQTQFIISLSGEKYTMDDLAQYGETIKTELLKVNGVTEIDIEGELTKQVSVKVDLNKMNMYGVSIENVLSLMQAQNISIPSGSIDYSTGSIIVNTPSVFESLRDIENTVVGGSSTSVAFVKLKDVADVSIEYADNYYYEQDSKPAVMLVGYFEEGQNAVTIGKRVRTAINELKTRLPDDLIFHEVMYSPEDVDKSIRDFIFNLIESVILIVVVVMVGVQLRNGIIISISIPLSIFITFIAMRLFDIEFQFISIAALIISLGILVDNSIVISEAIQQHLNTGQEKTQAIIDAVKETYMPVLTSTLTTFATFAVIFFVPGIIGKVVSTIPIVVISALTASYLVAMIITPVIAYIFFKPESEKAINRRSPVRRLFLGLLDFGLRNKTLTVVGSFATLIIAVVLATQLGIKFFPNSTKPVVYINVDCETASLSETGRVADEISEVLESTPAVEHYSSAIGNDLPQFFLTVASRPTSNSSAQFMLQLNEQELKKYGETADFARELQAALDERIVGATVSVKCLEYSMPTDAAVNLYVEGSEMAEINRVAGEISAALANIPGTDNVRDTAVTSEYEYVVNVDSDILSSYGLLKYDVVKQINTALMGASSATYVSGGTEMDIVVSADIKSLDDLYDLTISSSVSDIKVKLAQVADVTLSAASPTIKRYNGELYVTVLSNVLSGHSAFSIENALNRDYMDGIDTSNVKIESKGEFKNIMDLIGNLGVTASVAVLVIFVIIYMQFKSFTKPLIIIASIPLSLIGCCLGLWLFNMDLQAMAILGVVALFGIVVNNGIVLMEYMEMQRAKGLSVRDACVTAVEMRCRPIMLTSITTCIGLVPLVIANDPMTAPMASVLMFGMLFSTILTMAVVPVLYAAMEEKKEKRRARSVTRR